MLLKTRKKGASEREGRDGRHHLEMRGMFERPLEPGVMIESTGGDCDHDAEKEASGWKDTRFFAVARMTLSRLQKNVEHAMADAFQKVRALMEVCVHVCALQQKGGQPAR